MIIGSSFVFSSSLLFMRRTFFLSSSAEAVALVGDLDDLAYALPP